MNYVFETGLRLDSFARKCLRALGEHRAKVEVAEASLGAATGEKEKLLRALEEERRSRQASEAEAAALREQVEGLQSESALLASQLKEANEHARAVEETTLTRQLEWSEEESSLKASVSHLEKALETSDTLVVGLKAENEVLHSDNEGLRKEIEGLKAEVGRLEDTVAEAYGDGFCVCRHQVEKRYPDLDLGHLNADEGPNEDESVWRTGAKLGNLAVPATPAFVPEDPEALDEVEEAEAMEVEGAPVVPADEAGS